MMLIQLQPAVSKASEPSLTASTGKVVRAGEEAPLQEGDEVFGRQTLDRMRELNGTYAEYVIVESSEVYKKPSTREKSSASPPLLIS